MVWSAWKNYLGEVSHLTLGRVVLASCGITKAYNNNTERARAFVHTYISSERRGTLCVYENRNRMYILNLRFLPEKLQCVEICGGNPWEAEIVGRSALGVATLGPNYDKFLMRPI